MESSTRADPQSMDAPAGYRFIENLAHGGGTRLFRAERESDRQTVVIKTLKPDEADRETITLLNHEFELLRELDNEYIIDAYELTRLGDLPALVMEDIGGQSLDQLIKQRRINLKTCLGIATAIAIALKATHQAGIVHKDINPANILVNAQSKLVRLIDFGIATRYTDSATMALPTSVPGTPAYMSPEQTGRMNRAVDYRSDFYSLGATLYQLVTGRLLFDASEPLEWFHCHIAHTPVSPISLNTSTPPVVSKLIEKLLSKTAEDRYQSAEGLIHDLRECSRQLAANASIEDFPLGQRDRPDHFRLPQGLYGRSEQVARLLEAFEKAYTNVSLALVGGRSGIGKSSLINELHKPVTARRAYFITGKFDLVHRDEPYSGLIEALKDLVQQILTESNQQLERWRRKLREALGPNGGLITDLIPELELIMGPQPEVAEVGATESEQRFRLTLLNFIRVFSHTNHPLVLVLDDLQWADTGTLRLTDLLISQIKGDRLLVVGAYRDNEITPDHPLIDTLNQIRQTSIPVCQIDLKPLTAEDLGHLLSDAMMLPDGDVATLAQVVHQKTEGNPFFVEEFLKDQHDRGNIAFDTRAGRWAWDIDRLNQQQMTDNVAALMTRKLEKLPDESLQLLKLASCVGKRFSLSILSLISGRSPHDVVKALQTPLQQGLITPVQDAYQLAEVGPETDFRRITVQFSFSHDRIQESAYGLVDQQDRLITHLDIGRQLLRTLTAAQRKEGLFAIVTHLNYAAVAIDDPEEKRELCRLNLEAGHRARQSASYPIAYGHFQRAVALLGDNPWDNDYALALSAFSSAAEAAAYVGDRKALQVFLNSGLSNARDLLSRVTFHEIEISHYITAGKLEKAIDIALPLLKQLGDHYPRRPRMYHVIWSFLRIRSRLKSTPPAAIFQLPDLTSPEMRASCRIGSSVGAAVMFAEPRLLPLMSIRGAQIALDHGHSPETTGCFSILGMMFAQGMKDPDMGVALGRLALDLSERFNSRRGRTLHLYAALIQHWKEPLQNTYDNLRQAARYCMENGDFEFAAHASNVLEEYMLVAGEDLEKLEHQCRNSLEEFESLHMDALLYHQRVRLQVLANLRGDSDRPERLSGRIYDIGSMLPQHRETKDVPLVQYVLSKSMFLSYLFDSDEEGPAVLEATRDLTGKESGALGFYGSRWALFMITLTLLRSAGKTTDLRHRRTLLKRARHNLKELDRHCRTDPHNMPNKYQLCRAELLRVEGRDLEAHEAFDQAISLARDNHLLSEQAMASELCGLMHLTSNRRTIAQPYLAQARDLYDRWGARAKVDQLLARFPELSREPTAPQYTGTRMIGEVDMTSLMKALKVIADEQIYSRMVESIITIAIEFAGAQRGILALRDSDGKLRIEAESSVDGGRTEILQSSPLDQCESVSQATVNYVSRTRESIVVADALAVNNTVPGLDREEYILRERVRSILCLPITIARDQGDDRELIGLLYLENNHISNCFTKARFGALEIISLSAAGRLELSRKAAVDGLTNLFNHDYFQNMLRQELAGVARYQRRMSLLLIDVDHFKQFNDTWGHQLGDQVLQDVAHLIKTHSRENDTAARYGGEEMVVILPGANREEAIIVAERIRTAIEQHVITVGRETLGVTVSLGLSTASPSNSVPEDLIRQADTALYKSKANGRNQLTIAD